jgi:hypothetical protein
MGGNWLRGEGFGIVLKICKRPPAGGQKDGKTGRVTRGVVLAEGAAGGAPPRAVDRAGCRGEAFRSPVWALRGQVTLLRVP